MLDSLRGRINRLLGALKFAIGKLLRSDRLLSKGAAQSHQGEKQLAEAVEKALRWQRRRKE